MLIRCTNTQLPERIYRVGDIDYAFNEANKFTVEIPEHAPRPHLHIEWPDVPSEEVNFFMNPDKKGMFVEVKKAKKEVAKKEVVKKKTPKKTKKGKAKK